MTLTIRATTKKGNGALRKGKKFDDGERGVVADGTVRCGPLTAWPDVLDRLGVDAEALLGEFGLTAAHFNDPENTLPTKLVGRLFRRSVEATGCRHIAVLIGERITLSTMGAVGLLMQASPTVGHALQIMGQHFHVHDRGAQLGLDRRDGIVQLSYRITVAEVEAIDHVYTVAALAGYHYMRALCGRTWRPLEVQLPFRRPSDLKPLRQVLDAPLRFDADRLTLVFRAADLDRPVPTADPFLYRMMADRIELLEAKQRRDLPGRVRDLMRTIVFHDDSSAARVANRLGMSLRSLNRRLKDRGTSLQRIRDEVCADAACEMLASTEKPASEVALILGYSDPSAFTRAFRRWRGVAPVQWRAQQR
jgi:AraC-like DNA-binding protein